MPPVPVRSLSADALYRNGLTVWPGMTIFWVGDLAHQGEVSGHNPDDYPPLQAELTDADNIPEVRALDFMIGPKFTTADAAALVGALTTGVDKWRVYYVIYNRRIYRRATNFQPEPYSGGDPHTNHVHFSGYVTDDANGSDWRSVLALGEDDDMTDTYYKISSSDPVWNNRVFVSNRVHRRGPLRTPGEIQKAATAGANLFTLTDAMRTGVSSTESWDSFLDAVAGPPFPETPPGGLSADQVRAVVREELNKTKLNG